MGGAGGWLRVDGARSQAAKIMRSRGFKVLHLDITKYLYLRKK